MTAPDKPALKASAEVCSNCYRPFATTAHEEAEPGWCCGIRGGDCNYVTIARLRTENARLLAELEAARMELQKRGVCPHVFCSTCALSALAGYDFMSGEPALPTPEGE